MLAHSPGCVRPIVPMPSEVDATLELRGSLWAGALVDRDALRPGQLDLRGVTIGEPEPRPHGRPSASELVLCRREVGYAVDEHRLVAVEVLGEQQLRSVARQAEHGHPGGDR